MLGTVLLVVLVLWWLAPYPRGLTVANGLLPERRTGTLLVILLVLVLLGRI